MCGYEILVGGSVGDEEVGDHQDRVTNGDGGPLAASAEGSVATVNIYQLLPAEAVPDFADNLSVFLTVNFGDNQQYIVEIAGFFWLPLRSAAAGCIECSTGGLLTFQPVP